MEDSNTNKAIGVIPVHWFKKDKEKPNPVKPYDFSGSFKLTGTELRAKFKMANKPDYRLLYMPNDEAEVIGEIEIPESAVITLNEVKNFVVRLEEKRESARSAEQNTEPSDSSTVRQTDCDKEAAARNVALPISIPNTERFDTLCQDLLPPTGIPQGTVPSKILLPNPSDPSSNLTLDLIGSEAMYEDYWVLVLKIRNQIEQHFLNATKRTEAQWQSSVYQPLFEATSLQGLTTRLNPFCVHSKITSDAIATSKFRSFANGPRALKPDVADGWLVMNSENEAAFVDNIVKLNQEPFKGLEAKFGDCSHLLLDLVVELKKDRDDTSDMIKMVAELGIISSVLQYVTKMNHLMTFGFTVHKEYVVFYVTQPLEPLPLKFKQESKHKQDKMVEEQSKAKALKEVNTVADRTRSKDLSKEAAEDQHDDVENTTNNQKIENDNDQKAEDTAPKPRLEATQLFSWNLVNETQFFEFAIFLYRLYRLRLLQQCTFKIAFDQQIYKARDEVKQKNNTTASSKPANKSQSAQGHKSSDLHGEVPEGANSGDAMDVEHSPDLVDENEACSNPKLLKCIFKHSTGDVHLASSESHQQLIVKQFKTNSLKLLANECKVYKMLKGLSCIPKVISVSTEHSLGLEYIKGQHYCKAQTLDDVLQYMIMLLKALHDIHSRGVIHSDVKFANVIYDPQQPLMKVIDFSYSAIAAGQDSLVTCTGYTERYAAPEVQAWNCVGFASDVFSAGIMFTALLYGTKIGEEDYQFFNRLVNQVETDSGALRHH